MPATPSAIMPAKRSSILCAALSSLGSAPSVCHSVCLGIVTVLASLGLTLNFLPFMFAVTYQKYFWVAGIIFLLLGFLAYRGHRTTLTKNLLTLNAGLLLAALPWMPDITGLRLWFQGIGYGAAIFSLGAILLQSRWLTLPRTVGAVIIVLLVYNQWLIATVKKEMTVATPSARTAAVSVPLAPNTMSAAEHNSHHQ
ncbi:MAG: hypothetical protein HW383_104 [Candidatus Magasanikbacteria bacterium]|nr:hypothetical protein [Candidatus Magasanikbacteria bacterium]